MNSRNTKIMITLGPSTNTEKTLQYVKDRAIDFVRVNMSHSTLEELEYFIKLVKKVGLVFVLDTEGPQVRTGKFDSELVYLEENDELTIYSNEIVGNKTEFYLKPNSIIQQLQEGDILYIDFGTLILRVSNISVSPGDYVTAKVISSGSMGPNKAVVIDSALRKEYILPTLSPKDLEAIKLGLENKVEYIAASFIKSSNSVDEIRNLTKNRMKIISKIECTSALYNLDNIIQKSDYILIDRGDLSRSVPIERIPFTQKVVISKASQYNKGVFVATNLLETMIEKKKPTRAEIQDIINTIMDGATGLILAAETAIGKYPLDCINTLNKVIRHAELMLDNHEFNKSKDTFIKNLESSNYLLDFDLSSNILPCHGQQLINEVLMDTNINLTDLNSFQRIEINPDQQMETEQLATGAYSPLDGFMGKEDFESVLSNMRLQNGNIWPMPILLDVSIAVADKLAINEKIILTNNKNEALAIMNLQEKYTYDHQEFSQKLYGTTSCQHPGVQLIQKMNPVLLAGKITLLRKRDSETKEFELTPRQTRRLFEEKGWSKIIGFHTRNVIHRGHEFIQLTAMQEAGCDGLFVHPIVGKKKNGDFHNHYIIKSYEKMMEKIYPKDKVAFAVFPTFPRYAGPREALFTAICRKNFGCTHFIIGRDHSGVGNYYDANAFRKIFNEFKDLEITIVMMDEVFYSKKMNYYISGNNKSTTVADERLPLSGSEVRKIIAMGEEPPTWLMRPEISKMLLDAIKRGEQVFVSS